MPTFRDDMAGSSHDTAAIDFTKTPFAPASTPRKISASVFADELERNRTRGGVSRVRTEFVSDAAANADAERDIRSENGDDG